MSVPKLVPELICEDIVVTKKFYIDVLGFEVEYERVNEQFAYLSLNGLDIMVSGISGISGMSRWLVADMEKPFGRGVNFQWDVGDVDSMYAKVVEKSPNSIYLEMETAEYLCGQEVAVQQQFVVQDPDGYLLRFCRELS